MSAETHIEGLLVLASERSVEELVGRLKALMVARNLTIFAELDFSADAAANGLQLRPTRMLIAGNPKAGTPLIEAAATSAIDLPLKVLVWSGADARTHVAYNDPEYLGRRHGLSPQLMRNIAGLGALVEKAAGAAP
ncbi:MAG TPA: DUF302 domain-containing protein [Steroidobacteraceae bacterium]|jgi:uncharacterized protein (DUF302 family)|nr:DUF302 domain-containing protein [Steroidobacteraceae bacterium]